MEDNNDMKGLTTEEDLANCLYCVVLCEGCGPTQVMPDGSCIGECGDKEHGYNSPLLPSLVRIFPADDEVRQHYFTYPATVYFEYHCLESEQSSDAELWHRTHQQVKVLSMAGPDESDCELYNIQFEDGFIGSAFADELLYTTTEYSRPNYDKSQ
jgi:hypothetical protein